MQNFTNFNLILIFYRPDKAIDGLFGIGYHSDLSTPHNYLVVELQKIEHVSCVQLFFRVSPYDTFPPRFDNIEVNNITYTFK